MAKQSSKSKSSTKSKSSSKKSAPAPAPTPAPEPEPVMETVSETVETENTVVETKPTTDDQFAELVAELTSLKATVASLLKRFKTVRTQSARDLKTASKQKKRSKNGSSSPSGFTKPTLISNELADFLGVEHGTKLARTYVTKQIAQYMRDHDLQNPDDKRECYIHQDEDLSNLLGVEYGVKPTGDDKINFFNLQRYMKQHFSTKDKPLEQ
jgi:chromatin remodeling complex protein RSC6